MSSDSARWKSVQPQLAIDQECAPPVATASETEHEVAPDLNSVNPALKVLAEVCAETVTSGARSLQALCDSPLAFMKLEAFKVVRSGGPSIGSM